MLIHCGSSSIALSRSGVQLLPVATQEAWEPCQADLPHSPPDQEPIVQCIKLFTLWQLIGSTHLEFNVLCLSLPLHSDQHDSMGIFPMQLHR